MAFNNGTITWFDIKDRQPPESPSVYLLALNRDVIMQGFLMQDGSWCHYPGMDDMGNTDQEIITHWAWINLPE
jgi:hypothetical protein